MGWLNILQRLDAQCPPRLSGASSIRTSATYRHRVWAHRQPERPLAGLALAGAIEIPDLEGHPESPGQDGIVLEAVIDAAVRIGPTLRGPSQTPRSVEEAGAERLRIVCKDHAVEDGTMGILRGAQRVTLARLHPRRRVSRD